MKVHIHKKIQESLIRDDVKTVNVTIAYEKTHHNQVYVKNISKKYHKHFKEFETIGPFCGANEIIAFHFCEEIYFSANKNGTSIYDERIQNLLKVVVKSKKSDCIISDYFCPSYACQDEIDAVIIDKHRIFDKNLSSNTKITYFFKMECKVFYIISNTTISNLSTANQLTNLNWKTLKNLLIENTLFKNEVNPFSDKTIELINNQQLESYSTTSVFVTRTFKHHDNIIQSSRGENYF